MRKSEAHSGPYQRLFDLVGDGLVVHRLTAEEIDAHFIHANPAICQMLGYTTEEMKRLTPLDIQDEKGRKDIPFEAEKMLAEESLRFEKMLVRKDGTKFPAEVNSSVFYDRNRPMVLSSIRDMSTHKEAERKLHESEAMLARAQQMAHVGHWDRDLSTEEVRWSDETYRIFGLQPQEREVNGPFLFQHIHPDDRARVEKTIRDAAEGVKPYDEIYRPVRPDGSIRWVHARGEVIRTPDGKPVRIFGTILDITDRKQMEETLRRYQLLASGARDIILFVRRQDGRILEANEAATRAYSYRQDELLSLTIHDLRGVEGHLLTDSQMAEADSSGILFETDHRRKDGTTFPVEVSSRGMTIDGARVLLSVIRDITERKQAEEALRESEERFRSVFENAGVGMVVVSPEGRILQSNSIMHTMLGYSDDEFRRMGFADFTHPDDVAMSLENTSRIYSGERAQNGFDKRYIAKDGREVWGHISLAMVRDKAGRPRYHLAVVEDITLRKQTEMDKERLLAELTTERARWQATVESMLDPVTVCDAEGRATYMNRAYQGLIQMPMAKGLPMEAHPDYYQIYRPDGTLFPPEELPLQKAARRGEDVRDVELIQRSAEGREFTAIFSAAPLRDAEGRVTGAVAVGRDISEQRRVERALKKTLDELELRVQERTVELQQAYDRLKEETEGRNKVEQQLRQAHKMEAVGTLAGGIAHDFNNILAAIIGFSEMARDKTPEGSPARHHMERVFTAGIRGRDLVRQILTFSRQAEQEKVPLKLARVVRETLKLLRASLPRTIDIRMNLRSESGFVLADPTQMQQIVMNLCTNAAHAMRRTGGSISIDLAPFSFSSPEDAPDPVMKSGTYARLSVIDTGEGMSPEILDQIFDPFFTTKAAGEGTGLGLSVVHGIVASHGGTITVSSEPGTGSTFTVYLPKLLEERARDSEDGESPIPRGHESILFVDDEADLTAMSHGMLTDLGYRVTSRTAAREALALFRLEPSRFDLVITDQTMPEMTGQKFAGEILALRPDTPVIMCTGFSPLVDADSANAAGIRAFAMKPLTKREIAKMIREVLDAQVE